MDATQIILIVFIVLLIIIYPIMISTRNKKENQRMQEQTNSLKRGDKVLTTSGVYGTIVDLHLEGDKKIVTIETGTDKKKGYISVDAYAIYTIFKDEEQKVEDKKNSQDSSVQPEKVNDKDNQKLDINNENAENSENKSEAKKTENIINDKKDSNNVNEETNKSKKWFFK